MSNSYIKFEDLALRLSIEKLKDFSTDSRTALEPDLKVIQVAIDIAESIINDFLRGRYPVPFPAPNSALKEIAVALTIYKLAERRNIQSLQEGYIKSYDNAISLLKKYQNGEMILPYEETQITPTRFIKSNTRNKKFTSDILEAFNG